LGHHRHPDSADVEGRFGPRRLLRTGLAMVGVAAAVWLAVVAAATAWTTGAPNPLVSVLVLTFTILLWPAATLGLLVLACWMVLRILRR
jgi:hypothetical protein